MSANGRGNPRIGRSLAKRTYWPCTEGSFPIIVGLFPKAGALEA